MIIFKNSKGEDVVLNEKEKAVCKAIEKQSKEYLNALGIEIDITTLTTAIKSVSDQKFFEVPVADYLPVAVGEGAFSTELLKYVSYSMGGDFEDGIIKTGTAGSKLAQTDAGVEGIKIPIVNWAKGLNWNLYEIQTAARSGNWDLITAKEKSRKKNWDLGIQKLAFLGSANVPGVEGLLTLSNVDSDTVTIPKSLSSMTAAEFTTFVSKVYAAYRARCNYTAKPTHFVIPESDYNGLIQPYNSNYPLNTRLDYLKQAFEKIGLSKIEILPLSYAQKAISGLDVDRYVMYNADPDSIAMNIPVDYTSTLANTINGFQWENAAYGQYTSVKAYRPLEIIYFDY